jgi:hypothetical protein
MKCWHILRDACPKNKTVISVLDTGGEIVFQPARYEMFTRLFAAGRGGRHRPCLVCGWLMWTGTKDENAETYCVMLVATGLPQEEDKRVNRVCFEFQRPVFGKSALLARECSTLCGPQLVAFFLF